MVDVQNPCAINSKRNCIPFESCRLLLGTFPLGLCTIDTDELLELPYADALRRSEADRKPLLTNMRTSFVRQVPVPQVTVTLPVALTKRENMNEWVKSQIVQLVCVARGAGAPLQAPVDDLHPEMGSQSPISFGFPPLSFQFLLLASW
jgi:hypothetical protein